MKALTNLFKRFASRPSPAARLQLEGLEDRCVPTTLAVDWGQGVYRINGGNVQKVLNFNLQNLATDTYGDLAGVAIGSGTYRYRDGVGLQRLSTVDADTLDMRGNGYVVCSFSAFGIWRFEDRTGWQRLTTTPGSVKIDDYGDVLANIPNAGMWLYRDGVGWAQMTRWNASSFDIAGYCQMVFQFDGSGVWEYSGGWQHLTGLDATHVKINAGGDVALNILNQGVFEHFGRTGSWAHLTGESYCNGLGLSDNNSVVAALGGSGLDSWYNGGNEVQVNPYEPMGISYQD